MLGIQRSVMISADVQPTRETTLTYVHDADRSVFRGVVDATNIEIFRDFLAMIPPDRDVVLDIGDLEIRVAEAASLLVDRARTLEDGHQLTFVVGLRAEGPSD
jgi:hypothetical protein